MKIYFISILFASLIFLIVDLIWLNYSVKNFYRPNLGSLLNEKPIMWAAILFYLIYVFGLAIIIKTVDFFIEFKSLSSSKFKSLSKPILVCLASNNFE